MPQRTIAAHATRQLEAVHLSTSIPMNATGNDLDISEGTLDNIRLWDTEPLLKANRQLQQLRLMYTFPSAAVDRYPLSTDPTEDHQQVMVAAREIDVSDLPRESRTWLNTHLVFTDGQGFTVSPVYAFSDEGIPTYFVKNLGRSGEVQGSAQLQISNADAKRAFPVGRPQLYFGAAPSQYVVAPTKVREFDYPDGEQNVYSHYEGNGGIPLGKPLERLMAAAYLREPRLLLTGSLRSDSRLLLRRQVQQRLKALAPFLQFESQPYLITVTVPGDGYRQEQHQYWLLDGFTSSRSYPYSDANPAGQRCPQSGEGGGGCPQWACRFYVIDEEDPVAHLAQGFPGAVPTHQRHAQGDS